MYNLAIIMIFIGILILTYYLSKTYSTKIVSEVNQLNCNCNNKISPLEESYNARPSKIFNAMFSDSTIL